jgi:hypothetical protein
LIDGLRKAGFTLMEDQRKVLPYHEFLVLMKPCPDGRRSPPCWG